MWFKKSPVVVTDQDLYELRESAQGLALRLKDLGYTTPAYSMDNRPLPENFRERLEELKIFSKLVNELVCENPGTKGHKDLLWKYLSYKKFAPTSDVLDKISDDDCIEVYDMDGNQMFRSLNCFSLMSFSVEDLVSLNWKRAFRRSAKVTLGLLELVLRFATGYFRTTYDCAKVPVHIVEETSAKRNKIRLRFRYIAPLRQGGKCIAMLVVTNAKLLTSGPYGDAA